MTPLVLAVAAVATAAGVAIGRELERRESPLPSEGKIRNLIEYRVAVHEAGHAVCAWYDPYVTEITHITIDSGAMGEGRVSYKHVDKATAPVWWYAICVNLGGLAAEMEQFGKIRSGGAKSDLEKARDKTQALVKGGHMTPPWDNPTELPDKHFDVAKILRSIPSDSDEARILNLCFLRARVLVERDRKRLLRVARELSENGDLTEKDVKRLFGSRFKLFWL